MKDTVALIESKIKKVEKLKNDEISRYLKSKSEPEKNQIAIMNLCYNLHLTDLREILQSINTK